MNLKNLLASLSIAFALHSPAPGDEPAPVEPVEDFEIDRYLGAWNEIALIPNSFQDNCVAGTVAQYALLEESNHLSVLNTCIEASGEREFAEGRARFAGPADRGALEVTFAGILGLWLWPFAGDYIVIGLDPEYRWAAIGTPSREYAWVLARDDRLGGEDLAKAAEVFRASGYDACALLMSPREIGDPRTPLCEAF